MNHAELVRLAARWLRNAARCSVVLTEEAAACETPDAIGWRATWRGAASVLIECKVSRADFRAELATKSARDEAHPHAPSAVGDVRYYLTPPGILPVEILPPRWGLLERRGRTTHVVREAEPWPPTIERAVAEREMLRVALARVQRDVAALVFSGVRRLEGRDLKIARTIIERKLAGLPDLEDEALEAHAGALAPLEPEGRTA